MAVLRTKDFNEALWNILSPFDSRELNLMISGGSILKHLENPRYRSVDSSKWQVFFADERCSIGCLNYEEALPFLNLLKARVHPIVTASTACSVERHRLRDMYESTLKSIASIDVCLLGVGENGHICSLWPSSSSLSSDKLVEAVTVDCPCSPNRLTVTPKFINQYVKDLYFVIPPKNGKPKAIDEPHPSIRYSLLIDYVIILPQHSP